LLRESRQADDIRVSSTHSRND